MFSGVLLLSLLARNASILRGFLSISNKGSTSLDTGILSATLDKNEISQNHFYKQQESQILKS